MDLRRQNLGINVEIPLYFSSNRIYEDYKNNTSFYHPASESGTHSVNPTTGIPTAGPNWKLNINYQNGRTWELGNYTFSWTGGGGGPSSQNNDGTIGDTNYNFNGDLTGFSFVRDAASNIYTPTFEKRAKEFGVLRFMDPWRTNEYTSWTPSSPYLRVFTPGINTFYEKLLDPELIVDMCNRFHCSPWLCINHLSWLSPSYWTSVANVMQDCILPVYVEFSNEVWNPAFPSYQYLKQLDPSGSGDLWYEVLYPGAPGEFAGIMAWQMDQTELMGQAFKAVDPNKFVIVKGCQAANLNTLNAGQNYGDLYPHPNIDAVAINPYFGGPWARTTGTGTIQGMSYQEIVDECRNDWYTRLNDGTDQIGSFLGHPDVRSGRYRLLGYEGGAHLDNGDKGATDAHLFNASQSPEMGQFYHYEFLPQCLSRFNDVVCLYKDTGLYGGGGDIAWSHMPHETAEDLSNPSGAPYASDRWTNSTKWGVWA